MHVLYGAPGSGKTFAIKDLKPNYIYLSVDDTKQFTSTKNVETNIEIIQTSYKTISKHVSHIMHILFGLTCMYNYNVVLEMTGAGLDWYLIHFIDEFYHYKYNIMLSYFYTRNFDFLFERVEARSFDNYRFITKEHFMATYDRSTRNFKKILEENNIKKFSNIIVYDSMTGNIIYDKELNNTNELLFLLDS